MIRHRSGTRSHRARTVRRLWPVGLGGAVGLSGLMAGSSSPLEVAAGVALVACVLGFGRALWGAERALRRLALGWLIGLSVLVVIPPAVILSSVLTGWPQPPGELRARWDTLVEATAHPTLALMPCPPVLRCADRAVPEHTQPGACAPEVPGDGE